LLFAANFVGSVVSFLDVLPYTPPEPPPCRLVIQTPEARLKGAQY
jgi:hypothetical protein